MKISSNIVYFATLVWIGFTAVTLRSLCIQDKWVLEMCQSEDMRAERVQWQKEHTIWEEEKLCLRQWERLGACERQKNN